MFEVDRYMDQIKERTPKQIANFEEMTRAYAHPRPLLFPTRQEAEEFIVQRSREGVSKAKKELKKAWLRLVKCEKKFGNATQESSQTEANSFPTFGK